MSAGQPNRLASEKSPYLRQHAHNPVDWRPWNEAALLAAKSQNKPIFLSIGYSTCHWCHVMAHECFENPEIAALMNENFINIKVDREERPDLDAIYMSAVQALTGSGGWPMSVFLTPDLKPFYGGTYFPPEDRYGRPGFPTVLIQLSEIFKTEKDRIAAASNEIAGVIDHAAKAAFRETRDLPAATKAMADTFASLSSAFDAAWGGFSPAPKFPMPVYLDVLLHHHARTGEAKSLEMASFTVRKMAEGGLYDQLGGGFSRYSTDDRWLVPHFEKMLYDNAQLLRVLAGLSAATGDPFFKRIALETAAYLNRDLRHADGGYFSAEDADSEGKEGTFYLWTLVELNAALGDRAPLAAAAYGVSSAGNFMDPHTREEGKNVLSAAASVDALAGMFNLSPEACVAALADVRRRLFEARARRVRPHRDEKILTEWNGLAISAFSKAGFLLNEPSLVDHARRAAAFVAERLYDAAGRTLYRRWCDGERAIPGQQTDYAMFVEGLLDLFETTGEPRWLKLAADIAQRQDELFFDPAGGYFMSAAAPDLLVRMKDDGDNVIPSGNSVAAMNGLRLSALTGRPEFREKALATMKAFGYSLAERPYTVAKMVPALDWEQSGHLQVAIVGRREWPSAEALTAVVRRSAGAGRQVVFIEPGEAQREIAGLMPQFADVKSTGTIAAAYVCKDFSCWPPVADPATLEKMLAASD